MRDKKKQTRRLKKRRALQPAITVRPVADWFRGAWVVLKKRRIYYGRVYRRINYREFVIPRISLS